MPIKNSIGFYLSRDLFSPMDSPSFNQSAMDGYAIKFSKSKNFQTYLIINDSNNAISKTFYFNNKDKFKIANMQNLDARAF